MLRNISLVVLTLTLAVGPAFAAEHKGTGTWHWTWASAGGVKLDDSRTSDIGMVRGVVDRPQGVHTSVVCTALSSPNGASSGTCVHTEGDGDKWLNDYSCTMDSSAPTGALFACSGKAQIVGGTGKYSGVTGSTTFTIVFTDVLPDGALAGYTVEDYSMTY